MQLVDVLCLSLEERKSPRAMGQEGQEAMGGPLPAGGGGRVPGHSMEDGAGRAAFSGLEPRICFYLTNITGVVVG